MSCLVKIKVDKVSKFSDSVLYLLFKFVVLPLDTRAVCLTNLRVSLFPYCRDRVLILGGFAHFACSI